MKKIVLWMLGMVMLASLFAGCGDKFVGKWCATDFTWPRKIMVYDIEKNGKSYLIKPMAYKYDKKEITLRETSGFLTRDYKPAVYEFRYTWEKKPEKPMTAVEKDGRLVVDGTMGMLVVAPLEKTGELLFQELKLKKFDQKNLDKMKDNDRKELEADFADKQKHFPTEDKISFAESPSTKK
jgi:hypothetical protein